MFCQQCGAQVEPGAKFCATCGRPAQDQAAPPAANPVQPPPAAYSQPSYSQPQDYRATLPGASYPGAPQSMPPGMQKPANYLPWAIAVTLCCCVIGGIVGIVYSVQANSKWESGDYAGAHKAANSARTWLIISAIIGLIVTTFAIMANLATIMATM